MKKIISFLLVAVLFVSAFMISGCSDSSGTTVITNATSPQGTTTTTTTTQITTTTPKEGDVSSTTNSTTKPIVLPPTTTTTTTTKKPTTTTTTDRTVIVDWVGAPGDEGLPVDPPDPNDMRNWGYVIDDVYTAENGGFQIYVPEWIYYGAYGITLVKANVMPTSALTINVYAKASSSFYRTREEFEQSTSEDYEKYYSTTFDSFEKITITSKGKTYPCFKAVDRKDYYIWSIWTEEAIYLITFIDATEGPLEYEAEWIMDSLVIYK